jgi:hypothetical protein
VRTLLPFVIYMSGSLVCAVLTWTGYISQRWYWRALGYWCIFNGFLTAVWIDAPGSIGYFISGGAFVWISKYFDDGDGPRRKRKRLLESAKRRIPRPTLVKIRPIGAT